MITFLQEKVMVEPINYIIVTILLVALLLWANSLFDNEDDE